MATYDAKQRAQMAKDGTAMPDGSYPVANLADLSNAIQAYGRAPDNKRAALKTYLKKRAKALGASKDVMDTIAGLGLSESDQSLDAQTERVRIAWQDQYHSPLEDTNYVMEVYDDHVIACVGTEHYSVPYTEEGDTVTFDVANATKVERTWTQVAEGEVLLRPIAEAGKEPDGSVWEVRIIAAGDSKNRRRYPEAVLKKAVGLFEGARVLARSDQAHIAQEETSVEKLVGWIEGVTARKDGLYGRLNISEAAAWLRTMLIDAWSRGKRDLVGLSIVAEGKGKSVLEGSTSIFEVEEITRVRSVDVVFDPAAGGEFVKLVAAEDGKEGQMAATEEELTLEQLKQDHPELYAAVQADVQAELEKASGEEHEEESEEDKEKELVATEAADQVPAALVDLIVETELAKTKLPPVVARKVSKRFEGKTATRTEIREAVAGEIETFAELEKEGLVRSNGRSEADVEVTLEEADKGIAALTGFFLNEDVVIGEARFPRYRSIRQAYIDLTGDTEVSGRLPERPSGKLGISEAHGGKVKRRRLMESEDGEFTFAEAITMAQFDLVLGDSVTRAMVREYARSNLNTWTPFVDVVPVSDFRTQRRERFGGYGNLPAVSAGAAYAALTSPNDEEATYAASKRGGTETINLEAIANDDIQAIRRIPMRLARAAAQTLHEFIYGLIDPNVNAAIYDAVALYHATHANTGTTALSVTSLSAALTRMRKQAERDSSKRLGLIGRHLIIPIELEQLAYELTASDRKPAVADNDANFVRSKGIDYTVVDYWTDTNNWVLAADKADTPEVEVGFYGSETPELFTQDMPNVGSMFTNDQQTLKIRHIYGGAVVDYRGLDGSIV